MALQANQLMTVLGCPLASQVVHEHSPVFWGSVLQVGIIVYH